MVEGTYPGACWGLPRFRQATFETRFPFGTVRLKEAEVPLEVADDPEAAGLISAGLAALWIYLVILVITVFSPG